MLLGLENGVNVGLPSSLYHFSATFKPQFLDNHRTIFKSVDSFEKKSSSSRKNLPLPYDLLEVMGLLQFKYCISFSTAQFTGWFCSIASKIRSKIGLLQSSNVAFCRTPPIGGLSCWVMLLLQIRTKRKIFCVLLQMLSGSTWSLDWYMLVSSSCQLGWSSLRITVAGFGQRISDWKEVCRKCRSKRQEHRNLPCVPQETSREVQVVLAVTEDDRL